MVISPMRDQPKSCPEAAMLLVSTKVDVSDESSGNWIGFPGLSNNFQNIQCPMVKTELYRSAIPYKACQSGLSICSKFSLAKRTDGPKVTFFVLKVYFLLGQ